MTDEYRPGRGHPLKVDPTGRSEEFTIYSDDKHGYNRVICSKRSLWCKNTIVYVKDYEQHLRVVHRIEIDPVQKRLMQAAAMINPKLRRDDFVWAPFPYQIPETIYEMHLQEMLDERTRRSIKWDKQDKDDSEFKKFRH